MTRLLFRPEVAEGRRQRLHGVIVLTQPVRSRAMVFVICVIAALLAGWVTLGVYTRTDLARGILLTCEGAAKFVAIRPGQVTGLEVGEGNLARPAQRLAPIRVEQDDGAGRSGVAEGLAAVEAQRRLTREQILLALSFSTLP